MSDYKIALLCNAYSTNSDCFTLPMGVLVETIYGNGAMRINLPGTNCMASGSVTPLPMNLLDSLTVHAKMRQGHAHETPPKGCEEDSKEKIQQRVCFFFPPCI